MENSPNSHRMRSLAGRVGLPLGVVLLGAGGLCLWLQARAPEPGGRMAEQAARIEPLYATPARSLYLDNFQAPSVAQETWERAQKIIYARVPATRVAGKEKPLLASLASAISPVQEAHAETPAAKSGGVASPAGQSAGPEKKTGAAPAPVKTGEAAPVRAKASAPTQAAAAPAKSAAPATAVAARTQTAAPESVPPRKTASAKAETAPGEAPAPRADEAAFPATFSTGSLGHLTQLRAELEQLKLQVTIEETRSRLNQLRGEGVPAARPMPTLEYPPIGMPDSTPKRDKSLRILSIQSVNGKFTATVGTSGGPRVVSVNDSINGNRVVSISRNSVVINRGQGNETLSIQD